MRRRPLSVLPLSTTQRHGSQHSLNVHDIYRENVKQTSHCTWRVDVKSTWLVLISCREKSRCSACVAGDSGRWTMTLLIILLPGDRHVNQPHTNSLTMASICFLWASIVEFHKLLIHHETRTYLSPVDIHVPNVETE